MSSVRPPAAFYTVTDEHHFVGAVALLNSLRLVGHDEPFVVVDCGLAPWQRDLLEPVASLLPAPDDTPPMLLKATGPLALPADVMAVLDADVIVTRRLDPLLQSALDGKVVAFANSNTERFFPQWGELLGLGAPRRQTYVASGHLFVSHDLGQRFFPLFDEAQKRLDTRQTLLANKGLVMTVTGDDPFYFPDMDVLNALLATKLRPDEFLAVDYRLAPHAPFAGLELVSATSLACRYSDGTEPFVLHHILSKPWLAPTRRNAYSLLLPRLLLQRDVELRLEPRHLPLRLRTGLLAEVDRVRADAQVALRRRLRGRLGIRPRIAAFRAAQRLSREQQPV